jgi:hypothetical protein
LYCDGVVVEGYSRTLYTNHEFTQDFMAEALDLTEEANNDQILYRPMDVLKHMSRHHIQGTGYGMQQLYWVQNPPSAIEELPAEEELGATEQKEAAGCGM